MARSLVLVNEFGEVGLDHLFMESLSGDMVLLQSGCVCCTIQGDLDRTLRDIARRRAKDETPPFDRVLLETTGLADPAPILQVAAQYAYDQQRLSPRRRGGNGRRREWRAPAR